MRAYLFWHQPAPGVEPSRYESALSEFHVALNLSPPPGLLGSSTYRIQPVPWLPNTTTYEDWYEVEGSAALDTLENAAISAALRPVHDSVARLAAGGDGAFYRLLSSGPGFSKQTVSLWFSRPSGAGYGDFITTLRSGLPQDWAVWQRQMALGPSPEFCLVGPAERISDLRFLDGREVLQVGRNVLCSCMAGAGSARPVRPATPRGLAILRSLIQVGSDRLAALSEEAVSRRPGPGRWSPKEELGHLIDSAFNNHRRLVIAQLEDCPQLPGYDQNRWVEIHRYQDRRWPDLIALWLAANQQLCQAAEGVSVEGWSRTCTIKGSEPLTLSFLLDDYVSHALHHLGHLGMRADDLGKP